MVRIENRTLFMEGYGLCSAVVFAGFAGFVGFVGFVGFADFARSSLEVKARQLDRQT